MVDFPDFISLCNKYPDTDKDGDAPHGIHSYSDPYTELLADRRLKPLRVLEVGVRRGGSLKLWREFLPNSLVWGVDNGSEAGMWTPDTDRIEVKYADSTKPETLAKFAAECGPFDFAVDDGHHNPLVQIATFAALRPYLAPDFIYVIEDVEGITHAEEIKRLFGGTIYDHRERRQRHDDILVVFRGNG